MSLLRHAFCFLSVSLLTGCALSNDMTIETSYKKQQILGFGTQVWLADPDELDMHDLLGMRLQYARLSILPNLGKFDIPLGLGVKEYRGYIENNLLGDKKSKQIEIKSTMGSLRLIGVRTVLVNWAAPSAWEDDKGNLRKEAIDSLANLWMAKLNYLKGIGSLPDFIEILNEPHGRWGTHVEPDDFAVLLHKISNGMRFNEIKGVEIMGPCTDAGPGVKYVEKIMAKDSEYVYGWSIHEYESADTKKDHTPDINNFIGSVRRTNNKPVIFTEFSTRRSDFGGRTYDGNADETRSAAGKAVNTHRYAVRVVRNAISHLNAGANSLFYWEYKDQPWSKKHWGLLDQHGNKRPIYGALKLLTTNVPAGSNLLETRENDSDVDFAGFASGESLVLFIVNESNKVSKKNILLNGLRCDVMVINGSAVHEFGATDLMVNIRKTRLNVELKPNSINVVNLRVDKNNCD